jgi:hypothetical protein
MFLADGFSARNKKKGAYSFVSLAKVRRRIIPKIAK